MNVEQARWAAVAALVLVSVVGMAVAVAQDVECRLDCPVDDDVTWAEALVGGGTGLSPPAFLLVVAGLCAWLATRRGVAGIVGLAVLAGVSTLMTVAFVLDGASLAAARGEEGALAAVVALALLASVVATGGLAVWSFVERRRGQADAA